ncbi:MAG: hypothetical protein MUC37_04430 [Hyphomicrobium sp.]|nr:hypothetical protein [Hyphomicrobium sp.]
MNRLILSIAILASATLSLGQPALAGGNGVRLSFGGPLGTFVASPTPGSGSSGYAASPHKYPTRSKALRPAASIATVDRKTPRNARPIMPVSLQSKEKGSLPLPVTAASNESPGMLSRTLAAGSLPSRETVYTLAPSDVVVAQDVSESPANPAAAAPAVKQPAKSGTSKEPATCRKFIPAVGVTVTVGCP